MDSDIRVRSSTSLFWPTPLYFYWLDLLLRAVTDSEHGTPRTKIVKTDFPGRTGLSANMLVKITPCFMSRQDWIMFDLLLDTIVVVQLVSIRIYASGEVLAHDESRQKLNSTISAINQKVHHLQRSVYLYSSTISNISSTANSGL